MEFIMGTAVLFGGNFAPKSWAFCAGQLIAISQNQALYAILGTTWGGDGRTNFSLPDMQGRVPAGVGQGPGLSLNLREGNMFGAETVTLKVPQMPAHSHVATFKGSGGGSSSPLTVTVNSGEAADSPDPTGRYWGKDPKAGFTDVNAFSSTKGSPMATDAVTVTGGGGGITGGTVEVDATGGAAAFGIIQPILGIQFILCTQGVFPSRN